MQLSGQKAFHAKATADAWPLGKRVSVSKDQQGAEHG